MPGTSILFPDPFGNKAEEELAVVISSAGVNELIAAMDHQISSHMIPEWLIGMSVSRIYGMLYSIREATTDRSVREKIGVLLAHIKKKYDKQLIID